MRTANPALNEKTFRRFAQPRDIAAGQMTLQGTVNKTGILLLCALLTAGYTWTMFRSGENPAQVMPWVMGGAIGALILCIATCFRPTWAPVSAPLYALAKGLFLGGISAFAETRYPGIVTLAVGLTFGTLGALLMAYKSGWIKATENFKLGVVAATGAVFFMYLASMILGLFAVTMPFIHDSGPIGIGLSVVIVIIAALNLVLDFDFIEQGAEQGAPKFMEWFAAFGLLVTLVWLYIEILRLLMKLSDRR